MHAEAGTHAPHAIIDKIAIDFFILLIFIVRTIERRIRFIISINKAFIVKVNL